MTEWNEKLQKRQSELEHEIHQKNTELQQRVETLELEVDRLESFSRRDNIRMFGIHEEGTIHLKFVSRRCWTYSERYYPKDAGLKETLFAPTGWALDKAAQAIRPGP